MIYLYNKCISYLENKYKPLRKQSLKKLNKIFGKFSRTMFVEFILPFFSNFWLSLLIHVILAVIQWFFWVPFTFRYIPCLVALIFWIPYVSRRLKELEKDVNMTLHICKDSINKEMGLHAIEVVEGIVDNKSLENEEINKSEENEEITCYPKILLGAEESLEHISDVSWLNTIILKFWEVKTAALEDFIMNQLWPLISEEVGKSPGPFSRIKFDLHDLSIGKAPPRIDKIKIQSRSSTGDDTLIIDTGLSYVGDGRVIARVKIDAVPEIFAYIESIIFSCKFRLVLGGLTAGLPFLEFIQFGLLEFPKFGWNLGGATGQVAKLKKVDHLIRDIVNEHLMSIVSPSRIAIPLSAIPLPLIVSELLRKKDISPLMKLLRKAPIEDDVLNLKVIPELVGIVRVVIDRAENLPTSTTEKSRWKSIKKKFAKCRHSETFVTVSRGAASRTFKSVNGNENPLFNATTEFLIEHVAGTKVVIEFTQKEESHYNIGFCEEEVEFIKNNHNMKPINLVWRGLNGSTARVKLSYQWINIKQVDEPDHADAIAFSCTRIRSTTVCSPKIKVNLLPDIKSASKEGKDDAIDFKTEENWMSIPGFPSDDHNVKYALQGTLFVFQGGFFCLREKHNILEIQILDASQRDDEPGKRIWRKHIKIKDLFTKVAKMKSVTFKMELSFAKKESICRTVTNAFFGGIKDYIFVDESQNQNEPRYSEKNENLLATFQFKFFKRV